MRRWKIYNITGYEMRLLNYKADFTVYFLILIISRFSNALYLFDEADQILFNLDIEEEQGITKSQEEKGSYEPELKAKSIISLISDSDSTHENFNDIPAYAGPWR